MPTGDIMLTGLTHTAMFTVDIGDITILIQEGITIHLLDIIIPRPRHQ